MLVVGPQHEFGEERNLITVFAFGFHLIGKCGATIYDVLIALCGGLAGIIALSTKEKGNVIPGVAT